MALDTNPNLASFRNICRVFERRGYPDSRWIAEGLDESKSRFKQRRDIGDEVCCPLPFTLQDHCLLAVVSDLDSYQLELLASLPRWLRHRLLSVLPALDLSRLEHTPVATGVDVDSIWRSRQKGQETSIAARPSWSNYFKQPSSGTQSQSSKENTFQLSVCKFDVPNSVLEKEIKTAFNDVDQSNFPHAKKSLLAAASDILTKFPDIDLNATIHELISTEDEYLFSNLLSGCMHEPCQSSKCGHRVWKKQVTSLAINVEFRYSFQRNARVSRYPTPGPAYRLRANLQRQSEKVPDIRLTPHRLLPILYTRDPLEVLSLLARECSLQPSSAYIHVDSISKPFLFDMCSETLSLDGSRTHPSDNLSCTSIVHHFLEKVVILSLRCDSYSHIGVMVGMIEAATVDKENCQLKYLFCRIQNLYMDIVKPVTALFSLQSFHQLTLEVTESYPHCQGLCKLLHEFMTTPCSHTQKLMIVAKEGIALPASLNASKVAALNSPALSPLCSCQPEHKMLQLSSPTESTSILYLLLQLPTIRLKEIVLDNLNEYYEYIHLCAVHPDLQTTKLVINLDQLCVSNIPTIQQDLVSLFLIPSVRKIAISGNWGKDDQVKLALVQGLQRRARLSPLKKLALELQTNNCFKMRDFQMLCDAIFSLPQLEGLKVVLGKGFADMLRQHGYEHNLYRSWTRKASSVQLKSICLQTYSTEFAKLSLITQNVSFSSAPRRRPVQDMFDYSPNDLFALGCMWDAYDSDTCVYFDHDDSDYEYGGYYDY